jgi:hypothetical protein
MTDSKILYCKVKEPCHPVKLCYAPGLGITSSLCMGIIPVEHLRQLTDSTFPV